MAFGKFVKDNLVLITGILLPVLIVIFFLAASMLPRFTGTPPQYDFLFVSEDYHNNLFAPVRFNFTTDENGRITAIVRELPETHYGASHYPVFYRYYAAENTARPFHASYFRELIIRDGEKLKETKEVEMPDFLKSLRIDNNETAPDGYRLEFSHRSYNRSPASELFFMGSSRSRRGYRLVKDGNPLEFEVVTPGGHRAYYYSRNINFIGWITAEDTSSGGEAE